MSLYGIIADLRRENASASASRTLDMIVAELGRTNDNLRAAVANLDGRPIPAGGKPVLEELMLRASVEDVDDLERPPAPDEVPPPEPVDQSQIGIAVLLGGSALVVVLLAVIAVIAVFVRP
jgi:hypothetical protein